MGHDAHPNHTRRATVQMRAAPTHTRARQCGTAATPLPCVTMLHSAITHTRHTISKHVMHGHRRLRLSLLVGYNRKQPSSHRRQHALRCEAGACHGNGVAMPITDQVSPLAAHKKPGNIDPAPWHPSPNQAYLPPTNSTPRVGSNAARPTPDCRSQQPRVVCMTVVTGG